MDYIDEDGYPTEEALEKIANWPWEDAEGWFPFIKSLWRYPEYWKEEMGTDEFTKKEVKLHYISTVGWSGNESLVYAMEKNQVLWVFSWVQSRRGGHYIFEEGKYFTMKQEEKDNED